jgi:hypothetical protein
VTTNPFDPPAGGSFPLPLRPAGVTLTLPVAPLEEMRRRYGKERQRAVRRYLDADVRLECVDRPDERHRQLFWQLYRQSTDDWRQLGRPSTWVRDEAWVRALWHCSRDHLTMVTAWVGDQLAGAEILAVQGRVATELLSVWDRQFGKLQISTALTEGSVVAAHARGSHHLDGMPSGSLDGVERFKASFGAVARPIWLARHEHWLSRLLGWGCQAKRWIQTPPWAPAPLASLMVAVAQPALG